MNVEQLGILSNRVALLKKDREKSTVLLNQLDALLHEIHDEVPGCYERAVQLVVDWYPNMKASNTTGPSTGINSVSFNGKPTAAPGSPFGNPTTGLFGEGLLTNYGTTNHPFQPHVEREFPANQFVHYQTIASQECYQRFSVDELRLQDYANRVSQNLSFSTTPKLDNTPNSGPSTPPTGTLTIDSTSSGTNTALTATSSSNVKTESSTDESATKGTTPEAAVLVKDFQQTEELRHDAVNGTDLFRAPSEDRQLSFASASSSNTVANTVSSGKHAVGFDSSTATPAAPTGNQTASGSRWHPYASNQALRPDRRGVRGGWNGRRGRFRSSGSTGR